MWKSRINNTSIGQVSALSLLKLMGEVIWFDLGFKNKESTILSHVHNPLGESCLQPGMWATNWTLLPLTLTFIGRTSWPLLSHMIFAARWPFWVLTSPPLLLLRPFITNGFTLIYTSYFPNHISILNICRYFSLFLDLCLNFWKRRDNKHTEL